MLLSQTMADASRQILALRSQLFDNKKVEQTRPPLPSPFTVSTDNMDPCILAKYDNAQDRCNKSFAMAGPLVTSAGQFHIEGHVPAVEILDTGAGAIILGRKFASRLTICHPALLEPAGSFIAASGAEEHGIDQTVHLLEFTLTKGTSKETTTKAHALVSNTNSYENLLGMEFLKQTFGYADPLIEEFIWRVDCRGLTKMTTRIARLPVNVQGGPRPQRHAYM